MAYLLITKTVVAGKQHTAAHYLICFRITILRSLAWHVLKARLTKDVPGKYGTCLYVSLFKEYLQVATDKWCC